MGATNYDQYLYNLNADKIRVENARKGCFKAICKMASNGNISMNQAYKASQDPNVMGEYDLFDGDFRDFMNEATLEGWIVPSEQISSNPETIPTELEPRNHSKLFPNLTENQKKYGFIALGACALALLYLKYKKN